MWGKTIQIGHIGEPEVRANGNGKTYVRFGINMAKKPTDEAMWLNCIIGGRFAEVMKDRLMRGQLVFVEGALSFRKADNGTVYTNLMVDTCRILRDPRSANGDAGDGEEDGNIPF
ncbi:single-stranded DNA-binding protein [Halomonas cupida]|uniref:single-stranded DNA-binding protein n=1 Tax=Halomonas cupida TaxID=44933 RepID=UPI003EF7EE99|tara:strand:- start:1269 stop:1613 length:345 start_codon:yes stop_codon:yes gene_type:complete